MSRSTAPSGPVAGTLDAVGEHTAEDHGTERYEAETYKAERHETERHEAEAYEAERHEAERHEAEAYVAARVGGALEAVFDAVAGTRADTTALLARVAAEGRRPVSADLAALRPGLHLRLARQELVSGVGFVAAPGVLADVPAWLEWWQSDAAGDVRPLLLDLDPRTSAYSDYTHWDWFALPRDTGRRAVAGPYVDYLCSDEYSLTLSAPVEVAGRFLGVAAADVYLRHFEAAALPLLRELPGPARLVNARGRVAASADPAHLAGSLTKGPDFAAVLENGTPGTSADLRLTPCRGVPLVLVVDGG